MGINHRLRKLKQQADARLKSEQGVAYRKRRPANVEPIFANIKHNKNFKRFMLKGLDKVEIETGLLARHTTWPSGQHNLSANLF